MKTTFLNNVGDAELSKLEEAIGYQFQDINHLRLATTHSSYDNNNNYERYEFLGDSIVNFVIGKYLFNKANEESEGKLTKMRSTLICRQSLCTIARKINLGYYLKLAKGEIQNQGRERDSILEDTVEALIAAIYLDSNSFEVVEKIVLELFKDLLNIKNNYRTSYLDPKTLLQELCQELYKNKPIYGLITTEGKSHNQTFFVNCTIAELKLTWDGSGSSKRQAEQDAALSAIKELRNMGLLSSNQLEKIAHFY